MKIMTEIANISDLVNAKVNSAEYKSFKETVKATHVKLKTDIKEHVQRDPEAAGIVQFVKYEIMQYLNWTWLNNYYMF